RPAVVMRARQEMMRAVDGSDEPAALLATRERPRSFLAKKRVVRKLLRQLRANQGFYRAVCLTHIVLGALGLDRKRAAPGKVIVRELTGLARNFPGSYMTCLDGRCV